ncbi:DUF1499 domain-containing protein [Sneathiella glossodoripedis]|uniref:DUF1499 domain-containing protein n=1 Tax=Sneathiella glossodoripedis TaxID=418853 RepID=UPI00046FD95B|nr:DUF1499 domain-containing protein [Sneathiella glossodoripedis]
MISKILTLFTIGLIILLAVLTVLRLTPLWDRLLKAGDFQPTDFSNLTTPETPNWVLICPENLCQNATRFKIAPVFDMSRDELAARLKQAVKAEENLEIRHEDERSLDVVIRTPFMRWPDVVSIEFIEVEDGKSTFALFARAIYGRKDFGVNKERADKWINAISE